MYLVGSGLKGITKWYPLKSDNRQRTQGHYLLIVRQIMFLSVLAETYKVSNYIIGEKDRDVNFEIFRFGHSFGFFFFFW